MQKANWKVIAFRERKSKQRIEKLKSELALNIIKIQQGDTGLILNADDVLSAAELNGGREGSGRKSDR